MILRRLADNLRTQNWTAITIEFLIVVIGVFVGTQVSNWNEARADKAATERMLVQLIPELRAELAFFKNVETYYATSRRYADKAMTGWKNGGGMSDSEFVIAAYQASQITGIGINPDSWSLTFGGEQLRNIEDPNVRRNLEVVLTSDYSPVEFTAVATRYREQVRHVIPIEIQDQIREQCGDRNVKQDGIYLIVLPARCPLTIDQTKAAATAAALRARPELVSELRWHLAAVATYMANAEILAVPMQELQRELSATSQ
jgi:hypothetical protein